MVKNIGKMNKATPVSQKMTERMDAETAMLSDLIEGDDHALQHTLSTYPGTRAGHFSA